MGEVEADKAEPSELSQPWPKEVWPVPPLATVKVPVMVERVEVASQWERRRRELKHSRPVPAVVVDNRPAAVAKKNGISLDITPPVPPKAVDKVDEALHVPATIWARPVKAEELIPVPP